MTDMETARRTISDLLRQQRLGVLSTLGKDGPYNSLVAFAASTDDRHLYFATPRATSKFVNLSADARVALLVNNSINRPEDFHQAAAVTAMGIATPVSGPERDAVYKRYLDKHPSLEKFARSPESELVDIRVIRYILVEEFQHVSHYRVNHDRVENA